MTVPYEQQGAGRARAAALSMVIEWLEHPQFRQRVSGDVFCSSVTLGRTYLEIAKRTNHNDYDPVFLSAKERWYSAVDQAKAFGWLYVEMKPIGRPREKEYSNHEIANAYRRLRFQRSHELEVRDECIVGESQKTTVSVVTLQDNLWLDLLKDITAEAITGNTRADIAEVVGLPPRAAGYFFRWLRKNGWRQKRLRNPVDGSRTYVLTQEEAK